MNCKQGDLAIIVKSLAGNEGKIVRCLELETNGVKGMNKNIKVWWKTDTDLNCSYPDNGKTYETTRYAPDEWLRPIKGLDELEKEDNKELEVVK